MSTICFVLAGHLIGDWIVQTDRQASLKMTSWMAMSDHMSTYHLTMFVVVIGSWWSWTFLPFMLVSLVTHTFIDRRWPVKWLMRHTGSARFAETEWGVIAVDQALHISILLILVGILR